MKILVIGASGLLGKPVIEHLDKKGFQLRLFSRTVSPSMFINEYEIIQGDLFNPADLARAVDGCDAVHISIAKTDEKKATEAIVKMAKQKGVKLISMVSGCTVREENRWFKFIDDKFQAEQMIMNSGIPYMIFRPTWFFETMELMVRNGKATLLGEQPNPYHWLAVDDFGRMVAEAYSKKEAENKLFFLYGPEQYLMKDVLEKYCQSLHPEIKKVSVAPLPLLKFISIITGNKQLKNAVALFSYFQKVQEPEVSTLSTELLGRPEITLEKWIESKKN